MGFNVRDQSCKPDSFPVYLNTSRPESAMFFPFQFGRAKPSREFFAELKYAVKILWRPWSFCDMILERRAGADNEYIFDIVNTRYVA